jgi:hypothetical protein
VLTSDADTFTLPMKTSIPPIGSFKKPFINNNNYEVKNENVQWTDPCHRWYNSFGVQQLREERRITHRC